MANRTLNGMGCSLAARQHSCTHSRMIYNGVVKSDCNRYTSNTYTAWVQFSFVGGTPRQVHVLGGFECSLVIINQCQLVAWNGIVFPTCKQSAPIGCNRRNHVCCGYR